MYVGRCLRLWSNMFVYTITLIPFTWVLMHQVNGLPVGAQHPRAAARTTKKNTRSTLHAFFSSGQTSFISPSRFSTAVSIRDHHSQRHGAPRADCGLLRNQETHKQVLLYVLPTLRLREVDMPKFCVEPEKSATPSRHKANRLLLLATGLF